MKMDANVANIAPTIFLFRIGHLQTAELSQLGSTVVDEFINYDRGIGIGWRDLLAPCSPYVFEVLCDLHMLAKLCGITGIEPSTTEVAVEMAPEALI